MSRYREIVVADGPSAYFRLGETSGGAMNEIGGTGAAAPAQGTYLNSPTRGVTGAIAQTADKAVTCNGSNAYVSVPDGANVDLGDTFTLEIWAKRSSFGVIKTLIDKGTGAYALYWDAANHLVLQKRGTGATFTTTATITGTGWFHIVAVKTPSSAAIYVNGVSKPGTYSPVTMTDNATQLLLGGAAGPSEVLNGSIDEVALYKKALSSTQILAHYNAGVTVDQVWPDVVFEMALDSNPLDAAYVWRNYSEFLRDWSTSEYRQQELDTMQARTASFELLSMGSEWDVENTSSPYVGTLLPRKPVRISLDWYGVRYPVFTGYIEGWPPVEDLSGYQSVTIGASDGRALLAQTPYASPAAPTLMGSWDNGAFAYTDGANFGTNRSDQIWAQVTADWLLDESVLKFFYVNQDGDSTYKLATVTIPTGARATAGTRFPLELLDGDVGVRDVLSGGNYSSTLGPGKVAIYATPLQFPSAKSGTQVSAILDSIGWPAALRNVAPGGAFAGVGWSSVQGFTPSSPEESPLTRLDLIAQAEIGTFFFDRQGRATFYDRHTPWLDNNIKATFGDAGSELPYVEIQREGKEVKRIRNSIRITVPGPGYVAPHQNDVGSQASYGTIVLALDVPLAVREEAFNMAYQFRLWYTQPATRINSISVVPDNKATNKLKLQQVLGLEFGNRVVVMRRPRAGSVITHTARVQGISMSGTANPKSLRVTLALSPDVSEPWY